MPDYTTDQEKEVKRILNTGSTDYYKIIGVDKTASAAEIKKAYRKQAIKLHPDKNKHPQSAEAFKKLAKAFEVLGDEKKKSYFDQTGADPDSRGGAPSGNSGGYSGGQQYSSGTPFQGFQGFQGGHGGMNDDLFDMLFGNGNGFTFSFDGNGFRRAGGPNTFYRAGGQQGRRQRHRSQQGTGRRRSEGAAQGEEREESPLLQLFYQYLPLLLVVVPMVFNMLVDAVGTGGGLFNRMPDFSFETSPAYSVERTTPNLGVTYYLSNEGRQQVYSKNDNGRTLHKLDVKAEDRYVKDLRMRCKREQNTKERMIEDAYGFFFVDKEKLKDAQGYRAQSCERLRELNLL